MCKACYDSNIHSAASLVIAVRKWSADRFIIYIESNLKSCLDYEDIISNVTIDTVSTSFALSSEERSICDLSLLHQSAGIEGHGFSVSLCLVCLQLRFEGYDMSATILIRSVTSFIQTVCKLSQLPLCQCLYAYHHWHQIVRMYICAKWSLM